MAAGVGARTEYLHPTGLPAADDSRCADLVSGREPGPVAHDARLTDHLRRRVQGHLRSSLANGRRLPVDARVGLDGTCQRRLSALAGTRRSRTTCCSNSRRADCCPARSTRRSAISKSSREPRPRSIPSPPCRAISWSSGSARRGKRAAHDRNPRPWRPGMPQLHRKDGVGDFPGPTLRCTAGPDLWQVATHLYEGPKRVLSRPLAEPLQLYHGRHQRHAISRLHRDRSAAARPIRTCSVVSSARRRLTAEARSVRGDCEGLALRGLGGAGGRIRPAAREHAARPSCRTARCSS